MPSYKKQAIGFERNANVDKNPLVKDPNYFTGGFKIYADRTALYNLHPNFLSLDKTLIYILDRGDGTPEFVEYTTAVDPIPGSAPYSSAANFSSSTFIDQVGILGIQYNGISQGYQSTLNFVGAEFSVTNNTGNSSMDISLNLDESSISDLGTLTILRAEVDASGYGFVLDEDDMISNSALHLATQQSIKAYVDGKLTSNVSYEGGYDAATNTPDLDVSPTGIMKGHMYTVTAAGSFFTETVEVGDVLIAEQDGASLLSHWTVVQKNLDAPTIKTMYESNANTNVLNDANLAKLNYITIASAVDLNNIDHTNLTNIGVNTHAQIDAHIASSSNPHSTSDANLITTDVTTNNTSTLKHGFAPKLSGNPLQFLNGEGNWTTSPSATVNSYISQDFVSQTSVVVTHNFGAYPVVQVLVGGAVFVPFTITHGSINEFTVTFNSAQTGTILGTIGTPEFTSTITAPGNYTVGTEENFIDATGNGSTITLHTAVGYSGKTIIIKNNSGGVIFVDTTSGQTMDDDLTVKLFNKEALEVKSNGSNWWIL